MSVYDYTKSFDDPVPIYGYSYVDGGPSQEVVVPVKQIGSRSGQSNPKWKEYVKAGRPATTAFLSDRTKVEKFRPGNVSFTYNQNGNKEFPSTHTFVGVPRPWVAVNHLGVRDTEPDSKALSRLYAKLKSETQQWSGATFAAELSQTIKQLRSPLSSVIGGYERWRAKVYNNRAMYQRAMKYEHSYLDMLRDTWLEWAFGLQPLIADTRDAAEAIARFNFEGSETSLSRLRDAARSRAFTTSSATTSSAGFGAGNVSMWFREHMDTRTEFRTQYVCGLSGEIQAAFGSTDRLIELCGFKAVDFIPALWNALPWSWLLDYVANIGDILEASATSTSRVSWICRTDSAVTVRRTSYEGGYLVPGGWSYERTNNQEYGSYLATRKTVQRSVPVSLGIPSFYLRSPLGNPEKVANLLAVFTKGDGLSNALKLGRNGLG